MDDPTLDDSPEDAAFRGRAAGEDVEGGGPGERQRVGLDEDALAAVCAARLGLLPAGKRRGGTRAAHGASS